MKRICNFLLLIVLVSSFLSCEDFMDIHKDFIKDGEIIYAPMPDTISFIAGKNRVLFNCRTYNAPNIRSIDVFWNGGMDSLIIPVELNTGYDSISVILENLEEKSYTFTVWMVDNFGHKSLPVTDFGTSYGELYNSSLLNRRVKSLALSEMGGTIEWYSSASGFVRNEIRYKKIDGTIGFALSEGNVTELPAAAANSSFEYRTLYIPEEEAIDTFATAWEQYAEAFPVEFVYDRSTWKVLAVSDETASSGGGKDALLDGNLDSYWHSQWEGSEAPLPHWAIIDMQSVKNISKIDVFRRKGNTDAKTVEIFASNHISNDYVGDWVKIGSGVFSNGDKLEVLVSSIDKYRYLKIYLPDSNRAPNTSIAEVYVYGN